MASGLSREAFEMLVQRAGLRLSAAQVAELHEGWGLIEPMLQRVRAAARGREAEPALIFRPEPMP